MTDNKEMPERVFISAERDIQGNIVNLITYKAEDVGNYVLPESPVSFIRADKVENDMKKIKSTMRLLMSMIDGGEQLTNTSMSEYTEAIKIIENYILSW